MYFSILKLFHPIYSCFVDKEPEKIRLILIADFIFGISTDIAFNAFFILIITFLTHITQDMIFYMKFQNQFFLLYLRLLLLFFSDYSQ